MDETELDIDTTLRRLAAAELLATFPRAVDSTAPLSPEQLAVALRMVAIWHETPGRVRLVYDAGDLFHGNTVSVEVAVSEAEIDG